MDRCSIDLLSLAQSVLEKKKEELQSSSQFTSLFTSIFDDKSPFLSDACNFDEITKFEPQLQAPVYSQPITIKSHEAKENQEEENSHWTSIGKSEESLTLANTWESLPPLKQSSSKIVTNKKPISECGKNNSVQKLWTLASDHLKLLVGNAEIPDVEIITESNFCDDLIHLLCGRESATFKYDTAKKTFTLRNGCTIETLTFETIQGFVRKYIQMGNKCKELEGITSCGSNRNRGPTYMGLVSGTKSFLRTYQTTIAQKMANLRLMEMDFVLHIFYKQIHFVSLLFEDKLPDGMPLLVKICDFSLHFNDHGTHFLSLFLFKSAAQPFFRFLSDWIFLGKADSTSTEFGLNIDPWYLNERNRRFWSHAFQEVSASKSFGFMSELLQMIVVCGKTINFLRSVEPVRCNVINFHRPICQEEIKLLVHNEEEIREKSRYQKYFEEFCKVSTESQSHCGFDSSRKEPLSELDFKNEEICLHYSSNFQKFDGQLKDVLHKARSTKELPLKDTLKPVFTPLVMLLEKSVILPLRAQFHILNEKGAHYLIHDAKLLEHLVAIKNYILFNDGEFTRVLCGGLFQEMILAPDLRWGPGLLGSLVDNAIGSSPLAASDPLAKNVSFSVDQSLGFSAKRASLKLSYKTEWPINIILTNEALDSYGEVFKFLLSINKCIWGLKEVYITLKNERVDSGALRLLHFARHGMSHFVTMLDAHVRSINIEQSWILLEQEFQSKAKSVDSIYEAHMGYLNRIMVRCFLNKKAERVQVLFQDVLDLISSFCQIILMGDFKSENGLRRAQKVFDDFQKKEGFLSTVLWKLSSRGYQHHLQEFLQKLDK